MADDQHVHTEKCIWDSLCYRMFGTVPCNVKVMRRQKTNCIETEHNFILGPQPDHE